MRRNRNSRLGKSEDRSLENRERDTRVSRGCMEGAADYVPTYPGRRNNTVTTATRKGKVGKETLRRNLWPTWGGTPRCTRYRWTHSACDTRGDESQAHRWDVNGHEGAEHPTRRELDECLDSTRRDREDRQAWRPPRAESGTRDGAFAETSNSPSRLRCDENMQGEP